MGGIIMYNNEIYPVNYSSDGFNNQAANYDYYGMPPEHSHPCPEYPPMPPMPPKPPVSPMPPTEPTQGMRWLCLMHLKHILENAKKKKVSLTIEGAKGNFECTKVLSVNECTVMVDTRNGVCVIPLDEITAICMSKEAAKEVLGNHITDED